MHMSIKLGLTGLIAAFLFTVAMGTASARNLSVNKEDIRATWSRILFEGGLGISVKCQFTMEGSFHRRTIPKVLGTIIGAITRAPIKTESCTNARVTTARTPWDLTYEGFRGTLPNITAIITLLRRFLFKLERLGGFETECTYGIATDRLFFSAAVSSGTITNLTPEAGSSFNLLEKRNVNPFVPCPLTGELVGAGFEGQLTLLNSQNRVTVTLI
jgi:hypothetical protein